MCEREASATEKNGLARVSTRKILYRELTFYINFYVGARARAISIVQIRVTTFSTRSAGFVPDQRFTVENASRSVIVRTSR